jgi:hypothetical protein
MLQDPRRAGGRDTSRAEVVLEGYGYASERSRVAAGVDRFVDQAGREPGPLHGHQVEGVNVRFRSLDTGQVLVQDGGGP